MQPTHSIVQEALSRYSSEAQPTVEFGNHKSAIAEMARPAGVIWLDVVKACQAFLPVNTFEVNGRDR